MAVFGRIVHFNFCYLMNHGILFAWYICTCGNRSCCFFLPRYKARIISIRPTFFSILPDKPKYKFEKSKGNIPVGLLGFVACESMGAEYIIGGVGSL